MVQRQKYRKKNEPGKPDLKFRVRGKEHAAEDLVRWEARLATQHRAPGKSAEKWETITAALQRNLSQPPGKFLRIGVWSGPTLTKVLNRNPGWCLLLHRQSVRLGTIAAS